MESKGCHYITNFCSGLERPKLICHPSKMNNPLPALIQANALSVKALGSLTVIKGRGCFCQLKLELYLILTEDIFVLLYFGWEFSVRLHLSTTLLPMLGGKRGLDEKWSMKMLQPKHRTAWAAENLVHETLAPLKWLAVLPLSSVEPGFCPIYLFWFMKRSVIMVSKHWDTVFSYKQSF